MDNFTRAVTLLFLMAQVVPFIFFFQNKLMCVWHWCETSGKKALVQSPPQLTLHLIKHKCRYAQEAIYGFCSTPAALTVQKESGLALKMSSKFSSRHICVVLLFLYFFMTQGAIISK